MIPDIGPYLQSQQATDRNRRYELARDIARGLATQPPLRHDPQYIAYTAVAAADAILELLKTPPATPEPEPAANHPDTGTETPK